MSVATVTAGAPTLGDLVDGLAYRTGAWVVVERYGTVIAHGTGTTNCPTSVVTALISKQASALRSAVTWKRGGRPTGTVDGVDVTAVELGDGATAWFVGGSPDDTAIELLRATTQCEQGPVTDPVVQDLLHPRGLTRRGQAPAALLVVLRHAGSMAALSRRAAALLTGSAARVHAEDDVVLLALDCSADVVSLVARLRSSFPGVVAGVALVEAEASDWVKAARLATATARVAQALGLAVADPADPVVAAELVVLEAQDAVADLVRSLPDAPLRKLREHDARSSGELVASLTAWCRTSFDVQAAAAALHVHPNTLRYRLKRATEVSGLDVSRPRQLLALQLLLEV